MYHVACICSWDPPFGHHSRSKYHGIESNSSMVATLLMRPVLATLQGQRAQRIEMLLLHEFHSRKFLLPDRLSQRERERLAKRDAEEAGLDPLPEQAAAPGTDHS